MENTLETFSNDLAHAVERASRGVVAVNARSRISSSGIHWRQGIIVTAEHTLKRDEEISITLPEGRPLAATLAGRDPGTDLAVLRADGIETPTAELGAAEAMKPGNVVLVAGRSAESGVNAAMGIVSSVSEARRSWRGGWLDPFVRLDVSLYATLAGAAVADTQGRVLGVATPALSRFAAVALAIPTVNRVVDELLAKGRVARGYLGVGLMPVPLPEHLCTKLKLEERAGLMALSVEPEGPAGKSGVQMGDVLVALEGKPVRDPDDVQAVLEPGLIGKTVTASILRGSSLTQIEIKVGERPGTK